jgi:hypothetical protein
VHSRYSREVADLPMADRKVVLHLRVRRFRCSASRCPQRIFAEQVPGLAARRGRRSTLLLAALQEVGFALGGRLGARVGWRLKVAASRSTLFRLVRRAPSPPPADPRVLGVDDWAWRRGQRYSTSGDLARSALEVTVIHPRAPLRERLGAACKRMLVRRHTPGATVGEPGEGGDHAATSTPREGHLDGAGAL